MGVPFLKYLCLSIPDDSFLLKNSSVTRSISINGEGTFLRKAFTSHIAWTEALFSRVLWNWRLVSPPLQKAKILQLLKV